MYMPQDFSHLKEIFQSFRSKMVKVGELVGTPFPLLAKSLTGWALADRRLGGKWAPIRRLGWKGCSWKSGQVLPTRTRP